jgi:hypothetical protein
MNLEGCLVGCCRVEASIVMECQKADLEAQKSYCFGGLLLVSLR